MSGFNDHGIDPVLLEKIGKEAFWLLDKDGIGAGSQFYLESAVNPGSDGKHLLGGYALKDSVFMTGLIQGGEFVDVDFTLHAGLGIFLGEGISGCW